MRYITDTKIFTLLTSTLCVLTLAACRGQQSGESGRPVVSVSVPAAAYFVDRLAGDEVEVNVLVPQSVGHSTYTPTPSQMMAIGRSEVYLAFGNLDFELSWRERMLSANPLMRWAEVGFTAEHEDPHCWLSPRKAKQLSRAMAEELKALGLKTDIDSALQSLAVDIDRYDAEFQQLTDTLPRAFFIYHPALTHLAADYGFRQFAIEHEGHDPSPQTFAAELDEARRAGAKVVFVQRGFDMHKAEMTADELGVKSVEFAPEAYDWPRTMQTIIDALK